MRGQGKQKRKTTYFNIVFFLISFNMPLFHYQSLQLLAAVVFISSSRQAGNKRMKVGSGSLCNHHNHHRHRRNSQPHPNHWPHRLQTVRYYNNSNSYGSCSPVRRNTCNVSRLVTGSSRLGIAEADKSIRNHTTKSLTTK